MAAKPTLIFVPGAWHKASCWSKLTALLSHPTGPTYKCLPITLPSTLGNPEATILDDITAVRTAITTETSAGRDVVVVVHSYGGLVGQSAVKGLTKRKAVSEDAGGKEGEEEDGKGHVVGICIIASGFAKTGMSFIDGVGGKPPPFWRSDEESGFAVLRADARELFYHDLPIAEGEFWVGELTPHSLRSLFEGGEYV